MRSRAFVFAAFILAGAPMVGAPLRPNFPDRIALIANTCPYVELSDFKYQNLLPDINDRRFRFAQDLKWKNIGTESLVAFEVVVLKYDPFNRRLFGSRWTITGKNSSDWTALQPGESNGDGSSTYGPEEVFTAVAYVRSARLQSGTVWTVNETTLATQLKNIAPTLQEFGSLAPDPEPRNQGNP